MGIASYLEVLRKPSQTALTVYGAQLLFNFVWPISLFQSGTILFAFIWPVILWLLILITTVLFYRIYKPAGHLMLSYLIWATFARYLNFPFICWINGRLSQRTKKADNRQYIGTVLRLWRKSLHDKMSMLKIVSRSQKRQYSNLHASNHHYAFPFEISHNGWHAVLLRNAY